MKDKKELEKYKKAHDALVQKRKLKEAYENKEWYTIRSVLGNT